MSEGRCLACMKPLDSGADRCPACGAPVPCAPNPPECLQPGYVLHGRFLIGKVISRSGSSVFYIAFDEQLQTVRCIKEFFPRGCRRLPDMSPEILPEAEADFRKFSDRFLQQARIISGLSEDRVSNVVKVFDQMTVSGTSYIIMEYLDGCTADEWIGRRKQGFAWQDAVQMMKSVLQTVEEVHRYGYLHRNLSLSNIFCVRDGSYRLIGFGSAESIRMAKSDPGRMWPSSKRYYSPEEQISNSVQGPWTDVYAAGACLFKAVAGGWPSGQQNGQVYPSLQAMGYTVPEELDRVIDRATQPDPKKRYPNAGAMLEALNRVREDRKMSAAPASGPSASAVPRTETAEKRKSGKGKMILIIGIIAAAAAAVAVILSGNPGL